MKTLVDSYQIQVVWNREFEFSKYSYPVQEFNKAKKIAEDLLNSGDGARVKKYRIINSESNVVFPLAAIPRESQYPELYTCSYCDKEELGKPYSHLIKPCSNSRHNIALRPNGWDWMYVEPCRNGRIYWSCGCHKFN